MTLYQIWALGDDGKAARMILEIWTLPRPGVASGREPRGFYEEVKKLKWFKILYPYFAWTEIRHTPSLKLCQKQTTVLGSPKKNCLSFWGRGSKKIGNRWASSNLFVLAVTRPRGTRIEPFRVTSTNEKRDENVILKCLRAWVRFKRARAAEWEGATCQSTAREMFSTSRFWLYFAGIRPFQAAT